MGFVAGSFVIFVTALVDNLVSPFMAMHNPGLITWDITGNETDAQYFGRVCSARCDGTTTVHAVDPERCMACFPCSCHQGCVKEGTCCPDVGEEWPFLNTERSICTHTPFGRKMVGPMFLMVVACRPDFPSSDQSRDLCRHPDLLPRRPDTLVPVTSLTTKVTYTNVHCAACNDVVNDTVKWPVGCYHNQNLYDVINDDDYDARAVRLPDACGVKMANDSDIQYEDYHYCNGDFYDPFDGAVSACNVTGNWHPPGDEAGRIRQACERSGWPVSARTVVGKYFITFANIFCALCNGYEVVKTSIQTCKYNSQTGGEDPGEIVRTLVGLLSSEYDEMHKTSLNLNTCLQGHWRHPQGDCKQLTCTAGKQWKEGNQCVTAVDRVRGLGYRLQLLLVPMRLIRRRSPSSMATTTMTTTTMVEDDYYYHRADPNSMEWTMTLIGDYASTNDEGTTACDYALQLDGALRKIMGNNVTDISSNVTTSSASLAAEDGSSNTSSASALCFHQMYQAKLEGLMQHENVTEVSDDLYAELNLDMDEVRDQARFLAARMHVHLVASSVYGRDDAEKGLLVLATTSIWNVSFGEWSILLRAQVDNTDNNDTQDDDRATQAWYGGEQTEMHTFPYNNRLPIEPQGLEHLFLPLSDLLLCPYVTFDSTEFDVQGTVNNVTLTFPRYLYDDLTPVSLPLMTFFASSGEWAVSKDKRLMMCLDFYLRAFPQNVTLLEPSTAGSSLGHQITSAVCGSVSVLCLLLTLLTYSLFSQLRALPGLNNMGLSASLALAQLSLLVPWHRTGNADVCRAVGVFTHWLWLQALGWMAVCCTHMMRVFTSKVRNTLTERKTRRVFLYNVLFTAMLSAAVVGVTVGVAQGVSDGSSMGYGGSLCFLDTSYSPLLVLAFMIPLALILTTDLVCFAFTVVSIARVRRLQASQAEAGRGGQQPNASRWDVLVYLKLVTVTGVAWILGLVADAVDSEWVRVLAELCTAGQGLLIFLAYVCNVRVWHLYQDRFGLRRPDTVTTTTSTSANTTNTNTTRATVNSTNGDASVESKETTRI